MSGKAPDSVNYLKNNGFKFEIPRIPNVNFYIQQANIPSIDVDNVETKTLYAQPVYDTGGRISYGSLNLSFIVDEDMNNYMEIYNWIRGQVPVENSPPLRDADSLASGILIVMDNKSRPNIEVQYQDIFPVRLDEIGSDLTTTDPDPIIINTEFKFTGLKITKL